MTMRSNCSKGVAALIAGALAGCGGGIEVGPAKNPPAYVATPPPGTAPEMMNPTPAAAAYQPPGPPP